MWRCFPFSKCMLNKYCSIALFHNCSKAMFSSCRKSSLFAMPVCCGKSFTFTFQNKGLLCRLVHVKPLEAPSIHKQKHVTSIPDEEMSHTPMERCVNSLPKGLQPYFKLMRIHKPIGTWLLLWPCYWSLAMATPAGLLPDVSLLLLFGCGALLMRGAGCTINDMWDKDIDAKVHRTNSRPLASNELDMLDAWMFLGGQLSLALLLLLQLNWYSILLGASSLGLVVTYPLVKRVSYWPQLMLGFTFNWGVLLGWAAVHGSSTWPVVLPLYAACISWTLIYDTIYAHQDKVDDVLIKIKSTALKFGENTRTWLLCFSTSLVACLAIAGYNAGQTWPYYTSVGVASSMLLSQVVSLNINDPEDCWKKFKSNKNIGWVIFTGIVAGTLLKMSDNNQQKRINDQIDINSDYLKK